MPCRPPDASASPDPVRPSDRWLECRCGVQWPLGPADLEGSPLPSRQSISDRGADEQLLVAQLDWARHVMLAVCRRRAVRGPDAEEFAAWATLRLVENDYGILR